jgi:hypothetical protein
LHGRDDRYIAALVAIILGGWVIRSGTARCSITVVCSNWPTTPKVWIRAPDQRILISIAGFEKWVEGR